MLSPIVRSVRILQTLVSCSALCACAGAIDPHNSEQATEEPNVAEQGEALSLHCAPSVDPAITVPDGNRVAFTLDASGVQIYACQATASGYGWVFQAPEATLYGLFGRAVGKHYAGPTWEAKDGSKVVGTKLAAVTPDASAIPWLLLQATGHDGNGKMTDVTFIQRLNTVGGLAPNASTCAAGNVGEVARIDYTATYYFYEAGKAGCCKSH